MIADLITAREPTEEELEYAEYEKTLRPGKSTVLVQIVQGGSHLFEKWDPVTRSRYTLDLEVYESSYEGGSAALEDHCGMLMDAVIPMTEDFWHPGWVVVEGFYGHYSKDYWGEVDCDFECDVVRPARWSDYEKLMGPCRPWWAKRDRYMPQLFGHPGSLWERIGLWLSTPVSRVGEYDKPPHI